MTLYLTIYSADGGRPLPDGFQIEPGANFRWDCDFRARELEAAELEARLDLLCIAMESLGYEVSFTNQPPPAEAAPRQGFQVIK